MKRIAPKNKKNAWSTPRVHHKVQKEFKRHWLKITSPEINKIWTTYIEEEIIKTLEVGGVVYLDSESRIWVKATKTIEKKNAMALLSKGLMYKNGRIVEANMDLNTSEYIYDIVFETRRFKEKTKLYFQPHRNLSKAVRQGILKGKLITREYVN